MRGHLLKAVEGLLGDDVRSEQLHELGAGVGVMRGAVRVEHVAHNQHCSTRHSLLPLKCMAGTFIGAFLASSWDLRWST